MFLALFVGGNALVYWLRGQQQPSLWDTIVSAMFSLLVSVAVSRTDGESWLRRTRATQVEPGARRRELAEQREQVVEEARQEK